MDFSTCQPFKNSINKTSQIRQLCNVTLSQIVKTPVAKQNAEYSPILLE